MTTLRMLTHVPPMRLRSHTYFVLKLKSFLWQDGAPPILPLSTLYREVKLISISRLLPRPQSSPELPAPRVIYSDLGLA